VAFPFFRQPDQENLSAFTREGSGRKFTQRRKDRKESQENPSLITGSLSNTLNSLSASLLSLRLCVNFLSVE
jgi:hypothetical protein